MLALVGLLATALGAAAASLAKRYPTRTAVIETTAGWLIIGGLMLTGCAVPAMI